MSSNENIETEKQDFMTTVPTFDFSDPNIDHDCVLVVDGIKFHVLSGLLSIWSEYFKGLFSSDFKDSNNEEVEIKEVSAKDFEEFLKFIYPSHVKVNEHNVIALVEMSHRFLAPGIMVDCKTFIEEHFDKIDILNLLEISIKFGFTDTKERIGDIIFAFPTKATGYYRCLSCKYDVFSPYCEHGSDELAGSQIEANRFVYKNAKRIQKLSSEAQSYILQASVGNLWDDESKLEEYEEESDTDHEDEELEEENDSDESDAE